MTRLRRAIRRLRGDAAVRWRLTLLYGGLFLVCGAALLAITYGLVSHSMLTQGPVPFSFVGARVGQPRSTVDTQPGNRTVRMAPSSKLSPGLERLLKTPSGQAAARFVGEKQRTADLNQLELESGIALAIMALISGILGWFVAGRVLRPLEQALEAQRRFVANASHELRTPLTASRALIEMAITDAHATTETFRETCQEALEENEQQEQLIDALLALARGERGLDRREPVDLATIAADALREHRPDATARELDLDVALAPALVHGDRRLLARLVWNLVENAIRHNVPGGWVHVRVGTAADTPSVVIANSGPVVPKDEIARLLAPFQRLAADRIGQPGGFGLGLSIAAAIAGSHDAALEIVPGERGGLHVELRFPDRRPARRIRRTPLPARWRSAPLDDPRLVATTRSGRAGAHSGSAPERG
jgi:signal transduction histidine kinase